MSNLLSVKISWDTIKTIMNTIFTLNERKKNSQNSQKAGGSDLEKHLAKLTAGQRLKVGSSI